MVEGQDFTCSRSNASLICISNAMACHALTKHLPMCAKKLAQYWSYAFWVTHEEILAKTFFQSVSETDEKEKEKKKL